MTFRSMRSPLNWWSFAALSGRFIVDGKRRRRKILQTSPTLFSGAAETPPAAVRHRSTQAERASAGHRCSHYSNGMAADAGAPRPLRLRVFVRRFPAHHLDVIVAAWVALSPQLNHWRGVRRRTRAAGERRRPARLWCWASVHPSHYLLALPSSRLMTNVLTSRSPTYVSSQVRRRVSGRTRHYRHAHSFRALAVMLSSF